MKMTIKEKDGKPHVHVSVRNMVEFLLREGDISSGSLQGGKDPEAMLAGARIHKKIQQSQSSSYRAEVSLKYKREFDDLQLIVEGRADGIEETEEHGILIDEIKGMYLDVTELTEPVGIHLAQAKCYAAIYGMEQKADRISVKMTYANLDTEERQYFLETYSVAELGLWFDGLIQDYHRWASWKIAHDRCGKESMGHLSFPFPYRRGQRNLTAAVYHTVKEGHQLFLMAPTGVGKTMSCVYPSVRAIGEGYGEMLFYLTAKNETLRAGEEAFRILLAEGLSFKILRITSKEKICPQSEVRCNPVDCPYAKGHFDRINEVLYKTLGQEGEGVIYDGETILHIAKKYMVCPFELTLELSSWCDAVLCDYNYVFDPNVRLKRVFSEGALPEAIFLVDEVHNLVDRGREMYSAELSKEKILEAKRIVGKEDKKLNRSLGQLNQLMLELRHSMENPSAESSIRKADSKELEQIHFAVLRVLEGMQRFFETSGDTAKKEQVTDFYFTLREFTSTMERLDESYYPYVQLQQPKRRRDGKEKKTPNLMLKLFCVNPSAFLTECIREKSASVFFSATLLPVSYYKELLTTIPEPYAVYAPSPFPAEHRRIMIAEDVNVKYRNRGRGTYGRIASYIQRLALSHVGNYLIFFPSFQMMEEVLKIYRREYDTESVNWIVQSRYMSDVDREIFLENFYENPRESLVGFAVMGSIFSEGLDLKGTRLEGCIIVGCGLPQVSSEQELLRSYYDETGKGFLYAYLYPGMNKTLQAAGRVIRDAQDRGVILLLDNRFLERQYRELFPREWDSYQVCNIDTADDLMQEFWESDE